MTSEPIRVLIADDHPFFRDGVRLLLESIAETEVIGEASTGNQTVALALESQPDVILMDLNMPEMTGVEATRLILHDSPHIKNLVITMCENDDFVFSAMRAGARGYLLKGINQTELLRAMRAVDNGEAIFSPGIAARLISYFAGPRLTIPWQPFPDLTPREREILGLIAQGMRNTAIAEQLFLSPKTVRNHISNIFSKLQVADRDEAAARAREAGLGSAS